MLPFRRAFAVLALPGVAMIMACVSSGPQVELRGVVPKRQRDRVATVDLMPIDSRIVAYDGHPLGGGGVTAAFHANLAASVAPALEKQRYRLAAAIDRTGHYSIGQVREAMPPEQLEATVVAFLQHADDQVFSRTLLPAALPHRLGERTGSQATLFVGGYGIAGDDSESIDSLIGGLAVMSLALGAVGIVGTLAVQPNGQQAALEDTAELAASMGDAADALAEIEERNRYRPPRSALRLIVTLVDNATGAVIWHADRTFDGFDPTDPEDVQWALRVALRRAPRGGAR